MPRDEEDLLDACEDVDFSDDEISDDDLDGFTIFADIDTDDPTQVAQRVAEMDVMFNA